MTREPLGIPPSHQPPYGFNVEDQEEINQNDKHLILNEEQKNKLKTILLEPHIIDSSLLSLSFTMTPLELLSQLNNRLREVLPRAYHISFNYYLIGSKAGSLFVDKICNDTDLFLQCKIKIPPEAFANYFSVSQFFFITTKYILDHIRDTIEMIVKQKCESTQTKTEFKELSLKQVWDHFFTKKKSYNTPILSIHSQASNRFGMLHIGNGLEIKYAVDYEVGSDWMKGLSHPCTFVQDDVRVCVNNPVYQRTFEPPIYAVSVENPIEKVLLSLQKNELIIENLEPTKFIPHLLKFSLSHGYTTREHLEESFYLFIQKIDKTEIMARLANALSEKSHFEAICVIINAYTLALNMQEKIDSFEWLKFHLEKILISHLFERGKRMAQEHSEGTLIDWCHMILLMTIPENQEDILNINYNEKVVQLLNSPHMMSSFCRILEKKVTFEQFYSLYDKVLPWRRFDQEISSYPSLIEIMLERLSETLSLIELNALYHRILIDDPQLFRLLQLEKKLLSHESCLKELDSLPFLLPTTLQEADPQTAMTLFSLWNHEEKTLILSLSLKEEAAWSQFTDSLTTQLPFFTISDKPFKIALKEYLQQNHLAHSPYFNFFSLKAIWLILGAYSNADEQTTVELFTTIASLYTLKEFCYTPELLFQDCLPLLQKTFCFTDQEVDIFYSAIDFSSSQTYLSSLIQYFIHRANPKFSPLLLTLGQFVIHSGIIDKKDEMRALIFPLILHLSQDLISLSHTSILAKAQLLFNPASKEGYLIALFNMVQKPLSFENLLKIYQDTLEKNQLLAFSKEEMHLICKTLYTYIDQFLDKAPTKTTFLKLKELFIILKISINQLAEEDMAFAIKVRAKLLNYASNCYPDIYPSLSLESFQLGFFSSPHFIEKIKEGFIAYLMMQSLEKQKKFLLQILKLQSSLAQFKNAFLEPIMSIIGQLIKEAPLDKKLDLYFEFTHLVPSVIIAPKLIDNICFELSSLEEDSIKTLIQAPKFSEVTLINDFMPLIQFLLREQLKIIQRSNQIESNNNRNTLQSFDLMLQLLSHAATKHSLENFLESLFLPLIEEWMIMVKTQPASSSKELIHQIKRLFMILYKKDQDIQPHIRSILYLIDNGFETREDIQDHCYKQFIQLLKKSLISQELGEPLILKLLTYAQKKEEFQLFSDLIHLLIDTRIINANLEPNHLIEIIIDIIKYLDSQPSLSNQDAKITLLYQLFAIPEIVNTIHAASLEKQIYYINSLVHMYGQVDIPIFSYHIFSLIINFFDKNIHSSDSFDSSIIEQWIQCTTSIINQPHSFDHEQITAMIIIIINRLSSIIGGIELNEPIFDQIKNHLLLTDAMKFRSVDYNMGILCLQQISAFIFKKKHDGSLFSIPFHEKLVLIKNFSLLSNKIQVVHDRLHYQKITSSTFFLSMIEISGEIKNQLEMDLRFSFELELLTSTLQGRQSYYDFDLSIPESQLEPIIQLAIGYMSTFNSQNPADQHAVEIFLNELICCYQIDDNISIQESLSSCLETLFRKDPHFIREFLILKIKKYSKNAQEVTIAEMLFKLAIHLQIISIAHNKIQFFECAHLINANRAKADEIQQDLSKNYCLMNPKVAFTLEDQEIIKNNFLAIQNHVIQFISTKGFSAATSAQTALCFIGIKEFLDSWIKHLEKHLHSNCAIYKLSQIFQQKLSLSIGSCKPKGNIDQHVIIFGLAHCLEFFTGITKTLSPIRFKKRFITDFELSQNNFKKIFSLSSDAISKWLDEMECSLK